MVGGYWGHEDYSSGVEVQGSLDTVPEDLGIDVHDSNVNEDDIYWAEACETGEAVLVKDGDVEFGNAPPANLLAYELFSDTDITVPDVGYSAERDEVYIEILEGYDGTVQSIGEGNQSDFMKCVAAKALIGDPDLMHNIGKVEDGYALIDPDQAGAPIFTFEEDVFDYLEVINSGTSFDISRQDFREAVEKVSGKVGEGRLEASLEKLEVFKESIPAYANFEPDFIRGNFRSASEGFQKIKTEERPLVPKS